MNPSPADLDRCPFCGEAAVAEVLEVWGNEFQLDTCCEGMLEFYSMQENGTPAHDVPHMIEAAVGVMPRRVICEGGSVLIDWHPVIRAIGLSTAKAFVRDHHQHCSVPAGWKYGAGIYSGSTLMGVVMVGRPVSRMLGASGDTLEVTRLCLNRNLAAGLRWNACSMLYGWAARQAKRKGYRRIVTYTRVDEPGTSLRASGWVAEAQSAGGSWSRSGRRRESVNTGPKIRWGKILKETTKRGI